MHFSPLLLRVTDDDDGMRLDRFLAQYVEDVGRKHAALLCQNGDVRLNGKRVKKSQLLAVGDEVSVLVQKLGHAKSAPSLHLTVIYESEDLVIVDKQPGVPCAALVGKEQDTIAGALLACYPEMQSVGFGPREPGLVHRLDTFTSGLLMAARTQDAFLFLREAIEKKRLKKEYLALVDKNALPEQGSCSAPLAPHVSDPRRVQVAQNGHHSETTFEVVERGSAFDLIRVQVAAGYRHQVRAHLAHLGAPLVGDTLYGSPYSEYAPRHSLHASSIEGEIPGTGAFAATSALPNDLRSRFMAMR